MSNLSNAILAMDAYNRGYNAGVAGVTGSVGNWSIIYTSSILGEIPDTDLYRDQDNLR